MLYKSPTFVDGKLHIKTVKAWSFGIQSTFEDYTQRNHVGETDEHQLPLVNFDPAGHVPSPLRVPILRISLLRRWCGGGSGCRSGLCLRKHLWQRRVRRIPLRLWRISILLDVPQLQLQPVLDVRRIRAVRVSLVWRVSLRGQRHK